MLCTAIFAEKDTEGKYANLAETIENIQKQLTEMSTENDQLWEMNNKLHDEHEITLQRLTASECFAKSIILQSHKMQLLS